MAGFFDQYNAQPDVQQQSYAGSGTTVAAPAARSSGGGLGGFLSRAGKSLVQAPEYFGRNLETLGKVGAAEVTGNKKAAYNAAVQGAGNVGLTVKNGQVTGGANATKKLAGNTAQLASIVLAPEAKAGLLAKAAQGAKIGAVGGAGSALANNQNVGEGALGGAITGGVIGGAVAPISKTILNKVLPKTVAGDTAKAVINQPTKVSVGSNLRNHLQQTEAAAGGFNAGAHLPGGVPEGLSLAKSQQLSALADKYHIPAGSPATRLQHISGQLQDAGQNLDAVVAKHNVPITPEDRQTIVDEFNQKLAEKPNAASLQNASNDLVTHFTGGPEGNVTVGGQKLTPAQAAQLGVNTTKGSTVNDLKDLNNYRKSLDEVINYSRSAASPNPAAEQAADLLRQTISEHVGNMAPEVSAANRTYSELKQLEAPTLQANNKLMQSGGGLYNRLLNNNFVKGAESKGASVGQKLLGGAPKATNDAEAATEEAGLGAGTSSAPTQPGILSKVVNSPITTNAAIVGAAGAAANPPAPQPDQGTDSVQNALNATQDTTPTDTTPSSGDLFNSDAIKTAILEDIQNTGGKNIAALTSLYNTFGKPAETQSTSEKNSTDNLNSALATLSTYNDQLNAAGGGRGVVGGNVENVLGKIPILGSGSTPTQVRAIESQKTDVATSIAKALTGGKPSSAQIKSWEDAIPNVTDSPSVARQKMENITESINAKLQSLGNQ